MLAPHAVDIFEPEAKAVSRSGFVVLCDHASNLVPADVNGGSLGLPDSEMARHIAYDVGAEGLSRALATALGAPAVLSRFSRLVIDPNRGEDDPTLLMQLYDRTIIPGNRPLMATDRAHRMTRYYLPYHAAVTTTINAVIAAGQTPRLVSIHSFTPRLQGKPPRPWHVGLLWDRDPRMAAPLLDSLGRDPGLVVGDNEPYVGRLKGDCMTRHGTERGLPHVLIEMRNDLIATTEAQIAWGQRLAAHLAALT